MDRWICPFLSIFVVMLATQRRPVESIGVIGRDLSKNETTAINLIERLLNKLDNRVRPNIYGPPLNVKCDFYIQSFGSIDEVNMDFQINVYFRQRWYDERLKFTDQEAAVAVPYRYIDRFWLPDIFFPNEKDAAFHNVVVPNQVIKIFPDGLVRYSVRLTLKLACPMYLLNFPLDYQDCFLKISSYSYTEADVILEWLNDDPMEINEGEVSLPQFQLLNITTGRCEEKYTTGQFSCLKATFNLRRQVGFYILQTYIPSMLIVSLSWVSFWISKDAVPARITLGVTTVLTMTTQLSSSRSATMKVSYPKAIDVWYAFCMVLVFGALVEYAFVNVLQRKRTSQAGRRRTLAAAGRQPNNNGDCREEEPLNDKAVIEMEAVYENDNNHDSPATTRFSSKPATSAPSGQPPYYRRLLTTLNSRVDMCCGRMTADGMDKCARIVFPLAFLFFNICYWSIYTQRIVFKNIHKQPDL